MGRKEKHVRRPRDAAETRRLLVEAAVHRFASKGYADTTVREIADDAGVNVALINRYFGSKEDLFETCLAGAARVLAELAAEVSGLDQLAATISRRVVDSRLSGALRPALLLLLRSSGDERAEQVRTAAMRSYAERLASLAGWSAEDEDTGHLLLRAQLVLATAVGMVVLRSQPRLEPLADASAEELDGPLGSLIDALLGSSPEMGSAVTG